MDFLQVISALGSIATAGSLVYLALQTRASQKQVALSNRLARLGAHDRLTDLTLQVDMLYVERPESRKYFYDGQDYRLLGEPERQRIIAMAEYLADYMENVLHHADFDGEKVMGEWREYCRTLMRDSPAFRAFLHEYGHWYDPNMRDMLDSVERERAKLPLSRVGELEIVELMDSTPLRDKIIESVTEIYLASFPAEERLATEDLFTGAGGRRVIVAQKGGDGVALGFAIVLPIPGQAAYLLEYMAVDPHDRCKGLGTRLLNQAADIARSAGAAQLFMELERPAGDGASHNAARRVDFYHKHDCEQVRWLDDYSIPNLQERGLAVPMLLYVRELKEPPLSYDERALLPALFDAAYGERGHQVLPRLLELVSSASDPQGGVSDAELR